MIVVFTPIGAAGPGPITPGAAYEFTFSAIAGDRLSLTTMMGQSNDWFYAPAETGIDLFENGRGISGDITSQMVLWDAGTEVDQEPGIGSEQGPRQKAPTTGVAENGVVRHAKDVNYGSAYTKVSRVMRFTIKPVRRQALINSPAHRDVFITSARLVRADGSKLHTVCKVKLRTTALAKIFLMQDFEAPIVLTLSNAKAEKRCPREHSEQGRRSYSPMVRPVLIINNALYVTF